MKNVLAWYGKPAKSYVVGQYTVVVYDRNLLENVIQPVPSQLYAPKGAVPRTSRIASDRAASDRAASDRAAGDRAAGDRAAGDRAAAGGVTTTRAWAAAVLR